MTTDRELLELAAKAPGVTDLIDELWERRRATWNPLTTDGDALRLAVSLRFTIKVFAARIYEGGFDYPGFVEIWTDDDSDDPITTEYVTGGDYDSTTRRAIVRAAAEIGKGVSK